MSARLEIDSPGMTFLLRSEKQTTIQEVCQSLTDDKELFYKIVEGISDILYVLDLNWRFVYLNHAAERYFFVQRQEVIGRCIWDVFPQAVSTILDDVLSKARKNGEKFRFEAPSFSEMDIWQAYTVYPNGDYITVLIRDITQRREKQLLSDEFFKRVFNAGISMMLIKTLNGIIIDANKSWLAHIGYNKEDVIGKSEYDLHVWANAETRNRVAALLQEGAIYNQEVEFKTKEGMVCIGLLSVEKIEIGSVKYYLESITDVTKQKELEKEMQKLDRLNLIGQMAAGISHEFRNPITTVRGFIQMLSGRKELGNIKDYFDIMIEEIDRANSIITEFLTLSKNKSLNLRNDNINTCIEKLFPMIQAGAFNDDKDVMLDLADDIPDICMDESEIRQLILNLTRNAIEASPRNSAVKVTTYLEGDNVVLGIHDQGNGIDEEILEKLGTPFFTTKVDGTGMGLVICYRIAERHHAAITIDTSQNGTSFLVKFRASTGTYQ